MPIKYGAMIRQTGGKLLRKALRILFTGRLPKLPTVNLVCQIDASSKLPD